MRGLCLSLGTPWKEGMDNWILSLANERKELERETRTYAGTQRKEQAIATSSPFSSSLQHLLNVPLSLTQAARFCTGGPGAQGVRVAMHVVLAMQRQHQATPGDLMQICDLMLICGLGE